jgi:lipoate-protein ligase B
MTIDNTGARWLCLQLPRSEYQPVLDLQRSLVEQIRNGQIGPAVIILVEHFPVFTLGRRGERHHFKVSDCQLKAAGISVVHVERGGHVTYHGPGQLVGYPIIDLRQTQLKVIELVEHMEEVMLRTAGSFGIKATRNPINRGVWVGQRKLGSIGIAVRRGVSFHGFALNVSTSLRPFEWIHPCGLEGVRMMTMEQACGTALSLAKVQNVLKGHFEAVFKMQLQAASLNDLARWALGQHNCGHAYC